MSSTMQNSSPFSNTPESTTDDFLNKLPKAPFMEIVQLYNWEGVWLNTEIIPAATTFRSSFQARSHRINHENRHHMGQSHNSQHHGKPPNPNFPRSHPHHRSPRIPSQAAALRPLRLLAPPPSPHAPPLLRPPRFLQEFKLQNGVHRPEPQGHSDVDVALLEHVLQRPDGEPFPLEYFCSGVHPFGPFFEQVVGYWEESRKRPEKILFLKHEELKRDPARQVSRIAAHLGRPFGDGGELADEVVRRCSFERLKNLEVNQRSESLFLDKPNSAFFRKGEVGDWKNYLTPEMEMRIDELCRIKLDDLFL